MKRTLHNYFQYLFVLFFIFSVQFSFAQKKANKQKVNLAKKTYQKANKSFVEKSITNSKTNIVSKGDVKTNQGRNKANSKAASWNYTTNTGNLGTTYSWIDCSGGTLLTLGDDAEDSFNWPFSFSFYDDSYTTSNSISVCSNGFIRLDGTASTAFGDARDYTLSSTSTELGQIIALGTQDCNDDGWVRYLITGSSPNRILTVEYNNLEIDYNDNNHTNIQVSFYETSNVVVIKFETDDVTATGADIGIHSGTDNYFHDWQDVDNGTNNTWIEYTPYVSPEQSTITAGATSEPATISSLIDTQGEAIINFDFTLNDDALNNAYDSNNLLFNEVVVKQGTGNDIADWTQAIAGAELSDGSTTISGTINSTDITFSSIPDASSGDFGFIADDGNKTYTLKVWLKSSLSGTLPATIDGLNLVFLVNESSFTLEATSSGFASGETEDSGATNNEVTVKATQLLFTGQPASTATSGVALTTQPIVTATDENANIDVDVSSTVTLSNSGSLAMSNNSMAFTNGVADFGTPNNFMFTTGGKYVMLSASDGSLNSVTPSTEIAVDIIVGCTIYSEDFNSFSIINDLDGSDGWNYIEITNSPNDWGIEARSGNGNCLTINDPTAFQYTNTNDGEGIAYYNTPIDATNFKNLSISFDWQCDAEAGYDWGNILWSIDGVNWSFISTTEFAGQSTWTNSTFDLSVADGQQFYIGFKWINDGSVGSNPPFAVDNIVIKGFPKFDYNFSYRQDTYEQVTGTVVTLDGQAGANISLPVGFDFKYDGTVVSSVRANENGWLEMSNTLTTSALPTNDLADVANVPLLAPFWDDLTTDGQTRIIYLVEGTAPSRTFTIEWKDILWGGKRENFQVKLYETSYVIEFWYGDMNTNSSGSASIGINNAGGCLNKMISIIPGTIPTASYTAENNSINSGTYLNRGLVYIFNPFAMQTYLSWESAKVVVGQPDFITTNTTASQTIAAGAYSSSVSSKGVLASSGGSSNRVLLWNDIQTANGQPADLVLGQTDFTSTSSGTSSTKFDNPYNVCFTPDGEKLIVVDASNNRVLIWNSLPTSNGQAADLVLGQSNFTGNSSGCSAIKFNNPTGAIVLPNGKLLITDNGNNRVVVYKSVPTVSNTPADYVIGQPDFTTNSVGTTASKLGKPWDCAYVPDGKLLISDDNAHRIMIYNEMPNDFGAEADLVIGNTVFGAKVAGSDRDEFDQPSITCSVEGKLAIADFGNSRVMLYERTPKVNGAPADYVLGQPSFTQNADFNDGYGNTGTASDKNMFYPYSICFDLNGRLYVNGTHPSGTGMHRIMIFGETPTETAELELSIVAAETNVCVYSDVEYTVEVTNNGPDPANSVVVNAQVPVDITATEYDASLGTYNQKSGYWTIPYIAVDETVTLTFGGEVQQGLAGTNVTAYANIVASKQKDSDFSNNAASEVVAVQVYHAPTTSTVIADQYINRNSHTIPVISFTVDDEDSPSDFPGTYTCSSSNTTLIPLNYTTNLVFAGTEPNKTLDITPTLNEYGYSDMELILTDSHGCHKNYDFKVAVGNIWEGNGSVSTPGQETVWDESNNWSSGNVPNSIIEAIIPTNPKGGYFPVIDVAGANCFDMIIEPKASVTLNDTYSLVINGDLTIQSDITGTGSLVDYNTNGNITVNGNISVERYIVNGGWHYLSASLSNVSNKVLTENVCTLGYNPNVMDYNEAYSIDNDADGDIDWMDGWERLFATPNTNSLDVANGYPFYTTSTSCSNIVEFSGAGNTLNTGNYTYTVTNQDDAYMGTDDGGTSATNPHRGWNLVGNPYPSGLNADEFLSDINNSSVIDGTVYFWDELGDSGFDSEGADYAAYNSALGTGVTGSGSGAVIPDQYISCGQAFFVHRTVTDEAGSNISFTNAMREAENSFFFKKKEKVNPEIPKVKLSVINSQSMYNEIVVGLLNDASDVTIKPKYDGFKPEGNPNLSFYSIKDNKALMFQGIQPVATNELKSIPLGIHAGLVGKYTFTANLIEYIPDSIGVYLEDKELNIITDLRKQNLYSVTIDEAGKYNERFVLLFNINHAPYLVTEIEDKTINAEEFTSFSLPMNTFADKDADNVLTYNAKIVYGDNLPTWLNFNESTLTFSGTPSNSDARVYPIKVSATDNFGVSIFDDFKLTVLSTNGVAGVEASNVNVYPNPTNGILYISSNVNYGFTYQITDVTGKIITKTNSNSLNETVDISNLTSGIYFVKVILGDKTTEFKVVLQK